MKTHLHGDSDCIVKPKAKVFVRGEGILKAAQQNAALYNAELALLATEIIEYSGFGEKLSLGSGDVPMACF
jgi:hypothetical protein